MPEKKTPAALGFRMPAEWEPQAAVWLSWPHRHATWPGLFRGIPRVFAKIVAQVSRFEAVRINCAARLQPGAKRLCALASADMSRVTFFNHATNDAWCRDHGPIFVRNEKTGEVAVTDWKYNAWGGKYPPFGLDNGIPAKIARQQKMHRFVNRMVLEGGSIDVNGNGAVVTSEQCLLNKNRNPHLSRTEIEQNLRDFLGVRSVLWLGNGIAGDDTDGHVDDIARFFKADGLLAAIEPNRSDPNHIPLKENLERMQGFRTAAGKRFEIINLPMPKPFGFRGRLVPASYANFLVVNGAVLVPQFRQKQRDSAARAILGDCFPNREIVPIDCFHLIWGLGTLHCISQQQPA